ncbi:L,D-transpeptidase [Chelatococcus reniformis]
MFIAVSATAALAACQSRNAGPTIQTSAPRAPGVPAQPLALASAEDGNLASMYAAIPNDRFPIPAVPLSEINPGFYRRQVEYTGAEPAGTIVIDPSRRYLYLVQGNGRAMRYGVGVGREGFGWSGQALINSKQEWPDWYPPKEMIERQPELKKVAVKLQSGIGVPGGPRNPLGARAMYLYQNGKDTLFRIHGTNEPHTIGTRVSSGCIRLINQDVIDLYSRVPIGTKVVVLNGAGFVPIANVLPTPEPKRRRSRS